MTAIPQNIDEVLGPDGLLAAALERYEFRPQQIEMAKAVERAFAKRRPLIVEAATGTGKTLAYLVPALMSGKRVVVSTGTKALQEQLFNKDIPFLARQWPTPVKACVLKGRKNYLCKLRFDEMNHHPTFRTREEAALWPKIKVWAQHTETGDRAEISGLPDDFATWNDLSVGAEACLGSKCKHHETCFVTTARRRASTSNLIVVNHHLFFADLALREAGFGEILPEYDAVIFDEAHHLESVATSYFGYQVSNWRFRELIGDIQRAMDQEDVDDEDVDEALRELDRAHKDFFTHLSFGQYDGRYELQPILDGPVGDLIRPAYDKLFEALNGLSKATKNLTQLGETAQRLAERCAEVRLELDHIMRAADARYVYFLELRDRGYFLQAAPIDLAELLRRKLLDTHDIMVFASATIATGGDFEFFKQRMGIAAVEDSSGPLAEPYAIDELVLPPVFDYAEQCLVYVPNRMPAPQSGEFVDACATVVKYLVDIVEGRAFVLFTSYGNLNAVFDRVAGELDYTVLKQGERPKAELLEEFRRDTHSVLFATSSFWEGVDVEGEALSLVIIDKLPFANPSDPLTAARLDLLDARGHNAFREFSLPSAALTLKQGFGRLIRSRTDKGIVAILDSRIAHKWYGRYFLSSLPPAPVVWRAANVRDWWRAQQQHNPNQVSNA